MNTNLNARFTRLSRILHWGIAACMLILFFTGFLRMKWMSKGSVIEAIKQQSLEMPREQMLEVWKTLREPMWQWHVYAAYAIVVFFSMRVIYMLTKGLRFPNPFLKKNSMKERLQGSIYLLFYGFMFESIVTGFYLKWIAGNWKLMFESIHKWGLYIFPVFILIHVLGIWMAERSEKRGIVSKMIGGDL